MIKGKPNLFAVATKELTQDGILTWLLQWASPTLAQTNPHLHRCGAALLTFFMNGVDGFDPSVVTNVWAERQWEKIDISVEIELSTGRKILLIIEDKTFSGLHGDQLNTYKDVAHQWCQAEGYDLTCAFLKIGGETKVVLDEARSVGFRVFNRPDLIECLKPFHTGTDSAVDEFLDYLEFIEAEFQSFRGLTLGEWSSRAWVGFFQFVENAIEVHKWHRVANPSGGFWNLILNWEYWINFPVYMQVEEGHLCYKVGIAEGEEDLGLSVVDANWVQDFLRDTILKFAEKEGYADVQKPYRMKHGGQCRTFAVVPREKWLGQGSDYFDGSAAIASLLFQLDFFYKFKVVLDQYSYEQADVLIADDN